MGEACCARHGVAQRTSKGSPLRAVPSLYCFDQYRSSSWRDTNSPAVSMTLYCPRWNTIRSCRYCNARAAGESRRRTGIQARTGCKQAHRSRQQGSLQVEHKGKPCQDQPCKYIIIQVPPTHIGWRSNDGEARKEANQRLAVVLPPGKRSLQVSTAAQTRAGVPVRLLSCSSSGGRGERVRVAGRSMQVKEKGKLC
jgi:hypothetical protein